MLLQEALPFEDMSRSVAPKKNASVKLVKKRKLNRDDMAQKAAALFLEIGAIKIRPDEPYTFASGLSSPVYVDCRKIISYPLVRNALMDFSITLLERDVGFENFDSVAGGETAGIPFAAWIADRKNLPMQYVRKKPKGYGRDAQIEGDIEKGKNVLLVEDLSTDGGSKLAFVKALRNAGAVCNHIAVMFYYDIFKDTRKHLEENGLNLHHVFSWWDVLAQARKDHYFDEATLGQVESFLNAPIQWSADHGGTYQPPN
ncbi:MAG: orotate phosphoribosyltransferase [Candidatus Halichondribacter symbioticus]